ncbi:hypothetical protein SPWS13_2641 [Shewanella putrefaciens]|nr:hypothetical protein SPWS13_2641 [Shewanella putrefaciens]
MWKYKPVIKFYRLGGLNLTANKPPRPINKMAMISMFFCIALAPQVMVE